MSWLEQEALLSIKILLIACLHQELKPFKSEIFHFFGHKRDAGMGLKFTDNFSTVSSNIHLEAVPIFIKLK